MASSAAAQQALGPEDFLSFNERAAEVGRLLFYDPILSGNRDISCGTCHRHDSGTGDGLSLGLGQGATGLGPKRTAAPGTVLKRVPRNAPPLWNLGARQIRTLFHDGRLEPSDLYDNDFNSPAEEYLPRGLNGILAAQALIPLTARFEMAGDPEENPVVRAMLRRPSEGWAMIARRVRTIPEYARMLQAAYPQIEAPEEIGIADIANALGDFINSEWRSFDSPYDRYLAGEAALTPAQQRGMDLFFDEAGCSGCHAGPLLTDQDFHALALPHIGPGRTRRFDPVARDVGRMAETDRLEDAYRFRTPALRNVALTAPYGHNGAYPTLNGIVRHHLDPLGMLDAWTPDMATLPQVANLVPGDFLGFQDAREAARLRARLDITPRTLADAQVADIVAFLHALTGGDSVKGRLGRPESVPSGLKVD
ncbi:methylamine utilization protein MauG [Rhodobacteraceae bacterium 2CG4]|uniref:Methylamine utilization protein MauG n=1 Tax=Halovulum marinum TaxID=2662447 RepID=A0A6L5Z224_9RHOB|nr:methylamine utilization protein MauG [Halovulum marinum]